MFSIILGIVMIIGGLTGKLVLIGTHSGLALAGVGVLVLGRGIWKMKQKSA